MAALCEALQRAPLVRARADLIRSALETRQSVLVQPLSRKDLDALLQHDDLAVSRAFELQSGMAIPLLAHGRLLGVIALLSATRIYGAKHLRLALELAQRAALAVDNARLYLAAQHAIRLRDEVLGVVAHDLRNPLGVILLQAELLRRRLPEPERKPSETIKHAATRMNRLIQDLLDVARIEADRLTVERDRLCTAEVVTDAVEAQAPEAASRTLELRLELPHDLPEVWADRHRLFRVFENLIGNAVKFTAPGGCVTVGAAAREAEVVFWVRDTGTGIPAEDQAHVFDRFWQARESDRRGAGMGLAIVKGIVEAHRGRIWLESSPGRGSTFFFTIPTAPRAEAGETEAAPPTPTFAGTRVREGVS
jgi:signal transduction histidine kinase